MNTFKREEGKGKPVRENVADDGRGGTDERSEREKINS